jgi:hypothetical protein
LIVHSAEWTDPMVRRFAAAGKGAGRVAALRALHRRYGMGVPNLDRATRSASDSLTLMVQDAIHPYRATKMRDAPA